MSIHRPDLSPFLSHVSSSGLGGQWRKQLSCLPGLAPPCVSSSCVSFDWSSGWIGSHHISHLLCQREKRHFSHLLLRSLIWKGLSVETPECGSDQDHHPSMTGSKVSSNGGGKRGSLGAHPLMHPVPDRRTESKKSTHSEYSEHMQEHIHCGQSCSEFNPTQHHIGFDISPLSARDFEERDQGSRNFHLYISFSICKTF